MAHILWRVFRRDVWASIFCKINFFNMNNLEFLRKIEQLDAHLQEIKAFAISIGAKEEAFSALLKALPEKEHQAAYFHPIKMAKRMMGSLLFLIAANSKLHAVRRVAA